MSSLTTPVFVKNRFRGDRPNRKSAASDDLIREVRAVHESLPRYSSTPLLSLPALARELGIRNLLVKDEGRRFGLKAFKALGASYAMYRWLSEKLKGNAPPPERFYHEIQERLTPEILCFTTATDGNHGRGVAWLAEILRQRAVIYVPNETTKSRVNAIESHGAEVVVVDGSYDEAVNRCRKEAEAHDRVVISDTSWEGYHRVPQWIAEGYYTLFDEVRASSSGDEAPDLVIVQGGVGALAAGAANYYSRSNFVNRVKIAVVEPVSAACLTESSLTENGAPVKASGKLNTVMAGLNCGLPSPVAWPSIRNRVDFFLTITDEDCYAALRRYYRPRIGDPSIVSGESGAAGLAGLMRWRERFALDATSTVLLVNTESDTDPVSFRRSVN